MGNPQFSVFTKPWKTQSLDELGMLVRSMGFDAVEYPLREGYQAQNPEDITGLCAALGRQGVAVTSLAAGIDVAVTDGRGEVVGASEKLLAACGENGIPVIRICQSLDRSLGFWENIDALRRKYDVIARGCERHGVTLGVQMHYGSADIANSYDSYILLKDYDPRYIAAVWDAGHSGLAGEPPNYALDCLWNHLCMVNFKAAYWQRLNEPEDDDEIAYYGARWTTGRLGMCPWEDAICYLKDRGYSGNICLPAEYSDERNVEVYTKSDLAYIKELWEDA